MRFESAFEPTESSAPGDWKLPARLLFRFSASCRYTAARWTRSGINLGPKFRLPDLHSLETGKPGFADFRMGWNEQGLLLSVWMPLVQPLPPGQTRNDRGGEEINLWIDTRDVHEVHHATRYCHRFFLQFVRQFVEMSALPISKSRGKPQEIDGALLRALLVAESDWLRVDGLIPAVVLTGFDPAEHHRLGFNYEVRHRSLGEQTFSSASPLPFRTDPSLWGTLELVPPEKTES